VDPRDVADVTTALTISFSLSPPLLLTCHPMPTNLMQTAEVRSVALNHLRSTVGLYSTLTSNENTYEVPIH
jgi:hypothetical protein